MKPSERFRLTLPLVLLLASIGIMVVAALQAQRAIRSHKRQAMEAVIDYTTFAAWSFRQHLKDELFDAAATILQPVNHGNGLHDSPRVPRAADLAHMLPWDPAGCFCHLATYPPKTFIAFTLGRNDFDAIPNIHPNPRIGIAVDTVDVIGHWALERIQSLPPRGEAALRWMQDTLTAAVRHEFRNDWQYGTAVGTHGQRPYLLAYRPMPTLWGDTVVYAFELAPRELGRLFGGIIDHVDLLPKALTRDLTNRELMVVEIRDNSGRVMYRTETAGDAMSFVREDRLPEPYGGFTVRASIKPKVAEMLIIGGLPRSRLPMLIGLLALAALLVVVAVQQLRRAAALTRMRADFVAAVSHELRTPLSQIRLYLDTMRLGRLSTQRDRDWSLDNMDREATRLSNLVENVLRFASIGRDRPAPRVVCDVSAEVHQCMAAFAPLAKSRRVSVAVSAEPGLMAPLSRDAFRVALQNLLDNAVKYGPAGQTVRVGVALDGDTIVVSVDDQGGGVPAAERTAMWEPFRRGSDDAARTVGGSGIGLSIVRDVMNQHGGRAYITDAPGGGARFVLCLPGGARRRTEQTGREHPVRPAVSTLH